MTAYPDFRPWTEIREDRHRRIRAVSLLFSLTVLLVIFLGWVGFLANDIIATSADAAYQARVHGSEAAAYALGH